MSEYQQTNVPRERGHHEPKTEFGQAIYAFGNKIEAFCAQETDTTHGAWRKGVLATALAGTAIAALTLETSSFGVHLDIEETTKAMLDRFFEASGKNVGGDGLFVGVGMSDPTLAEHVGKGHDAAWWQPHVIRHVNHFLMDLVHGRVSANYFIEAEQISGNVGDLRTMTTPEDMQVISNGFTKLNLIQTRLELLTAGVALSAPVLFMTEELRRFKKGLDDKSQQKVIVSTIGRKTGQIISALGRVL